MADKLADFFEKYIKKESVFKNKRIFAESYIPETIHHREQQINQIAEVLAPCLKNQKPSNIFIYGKTGTGKTLIIKHVAEKIMDIAQKNNTPIRLIYLNCKLKKIADTEYRIIAELARSFNKAIPPTGLPTDEVYNIFFDSLKKEKRQTIIILDEIDQLIKKAGDEIIYNLTRINSELEEGAVSLIGISNDLLFANNLDPRVKSSLSEEELVFPPYNALQLKDILTNRAGKGFNDDVLEEGVLAKCAAFAARDHGDARRALELLRVAAELAERENNPKIGLKHIDKAQGKIEKDRILDAVKTQPKQFQAVLYSIFLIKEQRKDNIYTGEVYELYRQLCSRISLRPLTQRRVSDVIAELDMLGIIIAKVISKGRFGRTREINLSLNSSVEAKIKKILQDDLSV